MIFQAFVPDWPGEKQHGEANVRLLSKFCQTTILDNPAHYMAEQWELARSKFDADIFLWVMADVWPPLDMMSWFNEMHLLFSRGDIGVVTPQIRWCNWQYDLRHLSMLIPDVYEIPCGDMLCWAIRRDVIKDLPCANPKLEGGNTGMDYAATAICRRLNLKVVRDYRFLAAHEEGTSPTRLTPRSGFEDWLATLDSGLIEDIKNVRDDSHQLAAITAPYRDNYRISKEELKRWVR